MAPTLSSGHGVANGHSDRDQKLRIAIVGGGLGGLAFALACQQLGIETDVYEQASAFKEIGNGLALQPNAARLINGLLGLQDEFQRISADLHGKHYLSYADYRTGEIITALPQSGGKVEDRAHRVPRSDMLDILRAPLDQSRLHTSKRLTELERLDDGYKLHFADGTEVEADLVVGADGIHSFCRKYLQTSLKMHVDAPVYGGQVVYRQLVPKELFSQEMQEILWADGAHARTYRGHRRHVLVFAVGENGRLLNVVAFIPEERNPNASESWTSRGALADLSKEVGGWCEPVQAVVEAMGKIAPDCMKQALYYRQPLPTWTYGQLILLGDSAHPILPHQGQGTGMAVEDAVSLAYLLQGATKQTLSARLAAHQKLRQPRTDAALLSSIAMGKVSSSPEADNEVSEHDRKMMSDRKWLWDYDTLTEVKKVYEEVKAQEVPAQ